MSDEAAPRFRAGDRLEDLCRSCKVLRTHTVFAASPEGTPLRVVCGYCGSQHNYRGGDRARRAGSAPAVVDMGGSRAGLAAAAPARQKRPQDPRMPRSRS
jgi:hypothetical protein